MTLKSTERKIIAQTNIHGHETPEEFFEKREIKINTVYVKISESLHNAIKDKPEIDIKTTKQIKSLKKATSNEINRLFQASSGEEWKETINKINEERMYNIGRIDIEIADTIIGKVEICKKLREDILKAEDSVNNLSIKTEKRLEFSAYIEELSEKFRLFKKVIGELLLLLEKDSFSKEIKEKIKPEIEGYETYIKTYYKKTQ